MKEKRPIDPLALADRTESHHKTLEQGRERLILFLLATADRNKKNKVARAGRVDPKNFASKMRTDRRHSSAPYLARWAGRIKGAERRGELAPAESGGLERDELARLVRDVRNAWRFLHNPEHKETLADLLFRLEVEATAAAGGYQRGAGAAHRSPERALSGSGWGITFPGREIASAQEEPTRSRQFSGGLTPALLSFTPAFPFLFSRNIASNRDKNGRKYR